MKLIGVTGGVGAGKSEILNYMQANYNCRILLADDAARALEAPGGAIYEPLIRLLEEYPAADPASGQVPAAITMEDGRINNPEMARRIFSEPDLLNKVNQLVHPAVKKYILSAFASADTVKMLTQCGIFTAMRKNDADVLKPPAATATRRLTIFSAASSPSRPSGRTRTSL